MYNVISHSGLHSTSISDHVWYELCHNNIKLNNILRIQINTTILVCDQDIHYLLENQQIVIKN